MTSSVCLQVVRWSGAVGLAVGLSGCSIRTLDSVAAAMAVTTQTERAQERAELQALAEAQATPESAPQLESQASYLAVIAQLQGKQLWFASLAHLDVLETQWPPTEHSQLLRADALRHAKQVPQSRAIYQKLSEGSQAAKALHGLGLLAAQEAQFDAAVGYLQAARSRLPTDAVLLSDLGYALLHTSQGAQAQLPLLQAAQLQPQNPRIHSNVAVYLVLHGASGEASAWMQQHQMSELQRSQVLAQAQQLATLNHAVASAPPAARSAEAPGGSSAAEAQQMTQAVAQSARAVPATVWMVEPQTFGARP